MQMEHPLKTLPSPLQADFNASPLLTTYVTSDSLIQASSISTAVCHSSLPEGLPGSPCCWQLTFPGIQDTGISQGTADSRGWTLEDTTAPENEPTNRLSELPTRMCPFAPRALPTPNLLFPCTPSMPQLLLVDCKGPSELGRIALAGNQSGIPRCCAHTAFPGHAVGKGDHSR